NPFDLTKTWPHEDYPLQKVGSMTLDRNPADYHTEIEQAAFSPGNTVPGTGISPDKMLMARAMSYGAAHRARIGVNHNQIPVNAPKCPVNSYTQGGRMRVANTRDPVYAPNSKDGSVADPQAYGPSESWHADGTLMRAAYALREDDDDF